MSRSDDLSVDNLPIIKKEHTNRLLNGKIITRIARSLLSGGIDKKAFSAVLENISSVVQISDIAIYENINNGGDATCAKLLYCSNNNQTDAAFPNLVELNPHHRWYIDLVSDQTHIGAISNSLSAKLASAPIHSNHLLSLPLFNKYKWCGFIVLHDKSHQRKWTDSDISFLSIISEMLSGYFSSLIVAKKLEEEKQNAEVANKAKTDFLANVSHEIRTPLNVIIGMTHLAGQTQLNHQQEKYLATINTSSQALLEIVDEILDFSKIKDNNATLHNKSFLLKDVLREIIDKTAQQANDKGLFLEANISCPPFALNADCSKLNKVLLNLCSNAIKFTTSGSILFRTAWIIINNECVISFAIEDTGMGISEEDQSKLFQQFTQIDTSSTREHGGTGLGLAVSSRLVELMGGNIKVESTLNEGSTFSFSVKFSIDKGVDNKISIDNTHDLSPLAGNNILLAEHNHFNQLLAVELLKQQQVNIDYVNNATDFITKITSNNYAVVLLDKQLVDNVQETDFIKTISKIVPAIPIILLLNSPTNEDKLNCLSDGANGVIAKPFNPDEFYAEILRLLCATPISIGNTNNEQLSTQHAVGQSTVQILDSDIGLKRVVGNSELYTKLLKDFIQEFANCTNNLKHYAQSNDVPALKREIHTLKGASSAIGAMALNGQVVKFEAQLHGNGTNINIMYEIDTLTGKLEELIAQIRQQYDFVNSHRESVDLPDNDLSGLQGILQQFQVAIKQGKVDQGKKLVARLEQYSWNKNIYAKVSELIISIDDYDYKKAYELLVALL